MRIVSPFKWLSVIAVVVVAVVLTMWLTIGQSTSVTPDAVAVSAPTTSTSAPISTPASQISSGPQLSDTAVAADFHPQVASVVEAQKTGKFPERLSVSIAPKPFDLAAFSANPQAYVNITEPGRVFQTAPAGPDAVPLIAGVDHIISVPSLGSTPLTVTGKSHAPVSFTILDGGMFDNHLSSTTVLADDKGTATVTYTATPGTVDDVQILVGSPLTVGTLTLVVHVGYPATSPEKLTVK